MDYIGAMNAAWRRRAVVGLTSAQWDVYSYLVNVGSERRYKECGQWHWPDGMQIKNMVVAAALGMSENTLIKSREVLEEKGFIKVKSGKTKSYAPTYYLIDYCNNLGNKECKTDSNKGGNEMDYLTNYPTDYLKNLGNELSNTGSIKANIYKEDKEERNRKEKKETTTTNVVVVTQASGEKKMETEGEALQVKSQREVMGVTRFHFAFTSNENFNDVKYRYLEGVGKSFESEADKVWFNDWVCVFKDGEALKGNVVKELSQWLFHFRNWWMLNIERIKIIDPKMIKNGIIPKQNSANNIRNTGDVKLDTTSTEWK